MKNKIAFCLLAMALLGLPLLQAMAWSPQDIEFDPGENILRNTGLGEQTPIDVITSVINWALGLLGLFALLLLIYGGFIWMWARGEEQEIEKAQNIIKGAAIGLVIILASYGIASYVFNNLVNITTP
jgi:hypothetical protein